MHTFHLNLRSGVSHWLAAMLLLLAGCGAATVSSTFPTMEGLSRPDLVLVYNFAVTPNELDLKGGVASGGTGAQGQTKEEIEVGRAFAEALSSSLVGELQNRGIKAERAGGASEPGRDTASLKGRFLRTSERDGSSLVGFGFGGSSLRARILVFQGTSLNAQLVSEAETALPSNLKPGLGPTLAATVDSDAKRMALQIADRFADYYKRQGWIE